LQDSFSVENAHIGDVLQAKIAQEVPLPDRRKVKLGSIVRGSVSGVAPDEDEVGVRITFRLNQLIEDDETTSVMTNLRAIASYLAVRDAQTPLTGTDSGTRAGWATTVQIGGDIRYGDGSLVRNLQKQKVGEGVQGGSWCTSRPTRTWGVADQSEKTPCKLSGCFLLMPVVFTVCGV
jgi:hypothetical protein